MRQGEPRETAALVVWVGRRDDEDHLPDSSNAALRGAETGSMSSDSGALLRIKKTGRSGPGALTGSEWRGEKTIRSAHAAPGGQRGQARRSVGRRWVCWRDVIGCPSFVASTHRFAVCSRASMAIVTETLRSEGRDTSPHCRLTMSRGFFGKLQLDRATRQDLACYDSPVRLGPPPTHTRSAALLPVSSM